MARNSGVTGMGVAAAGRAKIGRTRRFVRARAARILLPVPWLPRRPAVVMSVLGPGPGAAASRLRCRLSGSHRAASLVGRWQRHPDQLLDRTQIRHLVGIAKRDRRTGSAGPCGAADAMHIGFPLSW